MDFLAEVSDGDARRSLNALEIAVLTTAPGPDGVIHLDRSVAEESIQKKAVTYDADETEHYDTISAFIKSMRGSDPDAALYWLAKMLYAGEDIRFIARRIVIAASEDVGMADPNALVIAVAAQQAVEFVGLPEAQIPLAHATVYVATAPKSNRAWAGLSKALEDVRHGRTLAYRNICVAPGRNCWAKAPVTSMRMTMREVTYRKRICRRAKSTMSRPRTASSGG